ncbi:MAG: winged helix-turn-helix transcriptional regulator [Clostridiales bacterium]|nr:winged helix-turn-helix transcriptional regulator [Clostridiales bacterium]
MNNRSYVKEDRMPHDHKEQHNNFNHELPSEELLQDLGDLFKIFGDTTRIRIMFALYEGEMSVSSISELLSMTQPAISHQLKTLKAANLVATRRQGKEIYYHLSDEHVKSIIAAGFEHLIE